MVAPPRRLASLCIAALVGAAGGALAFSQKPVFIDPSLEGWAAPLETACFQAGCGQAYYVAGIYLGHGGELRVLSRAKVALPELNRRALGRYVERLRVALEDAVGDLCARGTVRTVVLTFYCPLLARGGTISLQVLESVIPADCFCTYGAIPLAIVDRNPEELPPP